MRYNGCMNKVSFCVLSAVLLAAVSYAGWLPFGTDKPAAVAPERVLVAYYSWSGNTKAVAERIAQQTGGRLLEITPESPYPTDYDACVEQAKVEVRQGEKPRIKTEPVDWDAYDFVFIGSPNWWSSIAPPVRTFLSQPKLADKAVALFVTHGGGGKAFTERDTRALLPHADFRSTLAIPGDSVGSAAPQIDKWVESVCPIQRPKR